MTEEQDGELIPARFWQTLKPGEFAQIVYEQNGCLNADQCARLWRLEDRNSEPPQRLQVLVSRADINRLWPLPNKDKRKR